MSQTRHKARRLATQALYTWQMAGQDLADIEAQYCTDLDMSKIDGEYFHELLHKVPARVDELDGYIVPLLDRGMEEVDDIERAILRLGCYELAFRLDVPYRVVINESIKLAKTFGGDQSHKFINGILDGVAKKLRAPEMNARPSGASKAVTKDAAMATAKIAPKITAKVAPKISTKAPTKTPTKTAPKVAPTSETKDAPASAPAPVSKYKPR